MTTKKHPKAKDRSHSDPVTHIRVWFSGMDVAGSCEVPEVLAGDVLLWLAASDGEVGNNRYFEPIVTVDGELQQTTPLPGHSFDAIFLRGL